MVLKENIAIRVDNLDVDYHMFERRQMFSFGKHRRFKALQNITFNIEKGDVVAIIGHNGAGKSTLLNAIGGNLRPSRGEIETIGKIFNLKGANPGLIPDLSARENVKLLCEVYGVTIDEREEFERSVEEFCELGEAYDRNYRTLSSGMGGRVGFGFTTALVPNILLMDETLGVGDEEFRKKAEQRAIDFMERGKTILLSTHSLNLARQICSRGILLSHGKVIFDGDVSEAVDTYVKGSES